MFSLIEKVVSGAATVAYNIADAVGVEDAVADAIFKIEDTAIDMSWEVEKKVDGITDFVSENPGKTAAIVAVTAVTGGAAYVAAPMIATTVGATGALGAASTGTAISTLSGAALTNASLAAMGGGAVAAGGSGIAGGTAVIATTGAVAGGSTASIIAANNDS